ncbi:MAG: hypothetical protein U1C53_01800 [Candidatus Veblenbacteria bacterium]|nr:hypothetical protein [Candidatus Veblenbacteria bacterium]
MVEYVVPILRWVVVLGFLAVGYFLISAIVWGRQCAYYNPDPYGSCRVRHRREAIKTICLALAVALLAEFYAYLTGRKAGSFVYIHMSLAILFVADLSLAIFFFTGEKWHKKHKYVVYPLLPFYVLTLLT